MTAETVHMAAAEISFDALAEMLQLPFGVRVVGAQWEVQRDSLMLKLDGPGLPLVRHGEVLQTIHPRLRRGPPCLEWPTP